MGKVSFHDMMKNHAKGWKNMGYESRISFYFQLEFQNDLIGIAYSKLENEPGIGIDRTCLLDRDAMIEFRDQLKAISPKLGALYELRNFAKNEEEFVTLMMKIGVSLENIKNPFDPPF